MPTRKPWEERPLKSEALLGPKDLPAGWNGEDTASCSRAAALGTGGWDTEGSSFTPAAEGLGAPTLLSSDTAE